MDHTISHLRAAQALLHRGGWCRGHLADAQGRHCMLGAVIDSEPDGDSVFAALTALVAVIPRDIEAFLPAVDSAEDWVTGFNDFGAQDLATVSRIFDSAVERLARQMMLSGGGPEGEPAPPSRQSGGGPEGEPAPPSRESGGGPEGEPASPSCMDLGEEQEEWLGVPEREPLQVPAPQEPERAPVPTEPLPQRQPQPTGPGVDPRWG